MSVGKRIAGARAVFPEEDIAEITGAVAEVLRGGQLILGPRTAALESAFARKVGRRHAVAVTSCTAALEIAYRHVGVAGKEVIVPANTFVATATAVMAAGGTPVFAEMDEHTYGLDVDDALSRVTPRTAAIVVVHIAGLIGDGLERLRREARERGIVVIEDCAHAHGATLGDRQAGSLFDIGCFSLYPTKVITSAGGGMLVTDDEGLASLGRSLRHHGQGSSLPAIVLPGNDWLMDEVRAVIGLTQLRRLDEFLAIRRQVASTYDRLLARDARFTLPALPAASHPAWYKYPVLLPPGAPRDDVRQRLASEHAIEAGTLYDPPCHLMPVFRERLGTRKGQLPRTEAILARQLTLPMHAALAPGDCERVVAAVDSLLRSAR